MAQKIDKGFLIPDAASVRKVAKAIQEEAAANPKVMKALKANPRAFLGARGLPIDSQRELLREAGVTAAFINGCNFTCVTTGSCCFTCWNTNLAIPAKNVPNTNVS